MTELTVGSKPWRDIRDYLLARAMYRAACTDTVAAARLQKGCAEKAQGVGIMEAVVACLPRALQLEVTATLEELGEALQSQAEAKRKIEADLLGQRENENRPALEAAKREEELLRQQLDIYECLFRDFPPQGGDETDVRDGTGR